jgi:hypothetical protein
MRSVVFTLLIGCISAMSLLPGRAFVAQGTQERQEAGSITEIRGVTYLKEIGHTAETRLRPRHDVGRKLFAGEKLRCTRGGHLKVILYGRTIDLSESDGSYPIPESSLSDQENTTPGRQGEEVVDTVGAVSHKPVDKKDASLHQKPNIYGRSRSLPARKAKKKKGPE